MTCVVLGLLGVIGFFIAYRTIDIPDPNKEFLTETTQVYYADGKEEIGQFAIQKRDSIDYAEMPQFMKDAVIAAENRTFWTDNGLDPKGILRAAFSNAKSGSTQGASTITQQYVKILYLTQERTWKRKAKEAILSLVTACGAAVSLVANPLFGALSDRTVSRMGRRSPWVLAGAILGTAALLLLSGAGTVAAMLLGWCLVQTGANAVFAAVTAAARDWDHPWLLTSRALHQPASVCRSCVVMQASASRG